MIGSANGVRIGITGLGVNVPERVMTNDDLSQYVDTTDEWIVERTGSASDASPRTTRRSPTSRFLLRRDALARRRCRRARTSTC